MLATVWELITTLASLQYLNDVPPINEPHVTSWTCEPACETGYKCMMNNCVLDVKCRKHLKFGKGPPSSCPPLVDPLNKPRSRIEEWFTKEVFDDLFPKANIGWGPHKCYPYNYEAFVIAARYFPTFGAEDANNSYTPEQNHRRDLATFFAHAVQETGENDASLYDEKDKNKQPKSDACFYRGGFYNWFEGGPTSSFLPKHNPGYSPADGKSCTSGGQYCVSSQEYNYFYPCNKEKNSTEYFGCYLGRGAIQISYNFNYGQFQAWLKSQGVEVDLLKEPNLVLTKTDPPLSVMASLWFYMTPQPPKPAMHDIIMGSWEAGQMNRDAHYDGPILGPTSLVINNECGGEDPSDPGGPGESRRIKAFKWFCNYFGVPVEDEQYLTCKNMPQKLEAILHNMSWQPDWQTTWKEEPCNCAPASYAGMLPYYQDKFYPDRFAPENEQNRLKCVALIYDDPSMFNMKNTTSKCLNYSPESTNVEPLTVE